MISRQITKPDPLNIQRVQDLLNTRCFGRQIHYFPTLPSTNRYALENACSGKLNVGDVVLADTQTAGYGRLGSHWHSPSGAGLWLSILLDSAADSRNLPLITLIGASTVLKILRNIAAADWVLKWPNDIYANGKKTAGLLAEARSQAGKARAFVLGIGINVNQNVSLFHPDIRDRAISLSMIKRNDVPREPLLASILYELEQTFDLIKTNGINQARENMLENHEILFHHEDHSFKGRISTFEKDGSLVFTSNEGQTIICDQGERCAIQPAGN